MSVRSLNKVLLIGNLTRDPELRYTSTGTAVCTFGLATNRSWQSADGGDRQEDVEYHRIVAWSKLAEICAQILKKGRKVYVEGRMQTNSWTGNDGVERKVTEVVIENMIALSPPKDGTMDDYAPTSAPVSSASSQAPSDQASDDAAAGDDASEQTKTQQSSSKQQEEVDVDDIPF